MHVRVLDREGNVSQADQLAMRGRDLRARSAGPATEERPTTVGPALLHVYVSVLSADRKPILLETYWSTKHIDDDGVG